VSDNGRLDEFYARLAESAKGWAVEELGRAEGRPIVLVRKAETVKGGKNLLIAAGFHGDEKAGVLAVLELLKYYRDHRESNIAFLPLVNLSGFELNQRYNSQEENPNRGFCFRRKTHHKLSAEGEILEKNIEKLRGAARDGFLSLHEYPALRYYYLYVYENASEPGKLTKLLLKTGTKEFGVVKKNKVVNSFNDEVNEVDLKKGVSLNMHDGSFEDYLHELGVPFTACSETPIRASLEKRVKINQEIAKNFINYLEHEV
jgi:hypothetical protein